MNSNAPLESGATSDAVVAGSRGQFVSSTGERKALSVICYPSVGNTGQDNETP
jgi:hypothetical protein